MKSTTDDAMAVLEAHGKQLFALLFRLTLRSDVAEDLLQDLFCKLAQSDGFRRADNHLAYAHRVATNLAFDWRRKAKRIAPDDGKCAALVAVGQSPLADLLRREELEQTLNAIGELPPAAREIIVLRYLDQRSYEEIAKQIGKTVHQVRALAHKALVKLRHTLNARSSGLSLPNSTKALARSESREK